MLHVVMTVASKTLEKYHQLSQVDKEKVALLCKDFPEGELSFADKQRKIFEAIRFVLITLVIIATLIFELYILGLPNSIVGFISGVFAFVIMGTMWSLFNYFLVEVFFTVISKIFLENLRHQKIRSLVEERWEVLQCLEKTRLDEERKTMKKLEEETARKYQKDFDFIIEYVSQGKTLLIPRSLIQFSKDRLAEIALSKAGFVVNSKNLPEEEKVKIISYYRNICLFLSEVEDDEIVQLEETLIGINKLLQDENVNEITKEVLLNEYTRISMNDAIQKSRENRMSKKYFEKFEEVFPSYSMH